MNYKWLKGSLVLSQHGNCSQAMVQRHITQPALSRRVKMLEEVLGVPLLDRAMTPVTLTRYGGRFESYVWHVLGTLIEARHELSAIAPATDDTLVMVSLCTLPMNILPDTIDYLRQSES